MTRPWLAAYPAGVPAEIHPKVYSSLVDLLTQAYSRHSALPAYRFMGKSFSFETIDQSSRALAAWLLGQGLKRGDRVAVMLPNVPQYPVAAAAILRAGCVVVNINPALASHELEFQLRDSGAKAILLPESRVAVFQEILPRIAVRTIVTTAPGDMLGPIKGSLVNYVERNSRRAEPPSRLSKAVRFNDAVAQGQPLPLAVAPSRPDDLAVLQYTSGVTAQSRAAVLLHRHLVANVLQTQAWFEPSLHNPARIGQIRSVCILPLHTSFGFHLGVLLGPLLGVCNLLTGQTRHIPALVKELAVEPFHWFPACNCLFQDLAQHEDAADIDWRGLELSLNVGAPLQPKVAALWQQRTGCFINEAYGLSETGAFVTCTAPGKPHICGHLGPPLPSTEVIVLDDEGDAIGPGVTGEIAVRGPQVMGGYWQRPDETARLTTATGFLRTGDLGQMDAAGNLRWLDRKRDRILARGRIFYPRDVEDALASMPGVLEVAAVGVCDETCEEAIKVVVVREDPALAAEDVQAFGRTRLAEQLLPFDVEFRTSLPRTALGALMRRELSS